MAENALQEAAAVGPVTESSFTALLGLPAKQAVELLHEPESVKSQEIAVADIWNDGQEDQRTFGYPFNCPPTFPTNAALVERAARFSVFASAEDSTERSSDPSIPSENSPKLKAEPAESESNRSSSPILPSATTIPRENQQSTKRKEREKVKASAKKNKNGENGNKDGEKLPYVHVRARRGQATDSHSLAERARREKINARMKLLQELVPGCSKISGTALVLDEIINHVQSLQRQVELLSMRLAAVNPTLDFNLDNLLAAESGCLSSGSFPSTLTVEPMMWSELQFNGARRQQHQDQHHQLWEVDVLQPPVWERDNYNNYHPSENSVFSYNSSADSVSMHWNQLKMEL